jgi:5'(3')-deoxyribonucleotidase
VKKIVYVDMDGVLVDFDRELRERGLKIKEEIDACVDNTEGFFLKLKPMEGAIEAFEWLSEHFEVYILTTAPWKNTSALTDKRKWVGKYLSEVGKKRLIITHNKGLNKGDYLIDDRIAKGVADFEGEHIHFDTEEFPDWNAVLKYLCEKESIPKMV